MGNLLVIDHPIEGRESFFLGRLLSFLYHKEGMQPDVRSYLKLEGVDPSDYMAVISASGSCVIRGNEQLKGENGLTDICEKEGIPTLYLSHGAQIMAVHLWGDDAIREAQSPRKGIHLDYEFAGNADPILMGVDIGNLASKEFHNYDIPGVSGSHRPLLLDPNGNVILAGHTDPSNASYLMQMHPEYAPKPEEKVNSAQLLTNFINLVK